METQEAIERLRELATARDLELISERESRHRAAAIVDRGRLQLLELVDYLEERGLRGPDLARAVVGFSRRVKALYQKHYGVAPLKRDQPVHGVFAGIYVYVEADRPLLDQAWSELALGREAVLR